MNKRTFALVTAVITFTVGVGLVRLSLPNFFESSPPVVKDVKFRYGLTGPYGFNELSIFLIHGPDAPHSHLYTPLQQAMNEKAVIVRETNHANELVIDNLSDDDVFMQDGDVVKRGAQHCVLAVDFILPAQARGIPISEFCVERSAGFLSVAESRLVSSPGSVALYRSAEVQESTAPYINRLLPIVERSDDVIGFAFAINDQVRRADVYSSNAMFQRLWPRLLEGAAIESVTTMGVRRAPCVMSTGHLSVFLENTLFGAEDVTDVNPRTQSFRREAGVGLFLETRDSGHHGAWVHRSYFRLFKD